MSRVSSFLYHTPFAYLRSTKSSLPQDGGIVGGPHEGETGDWGQKAISNTPLDTNSGAVPILDQLEVFASNPI